MVTILSAIMLTVFIAPQIIPIVTVYTAAQSADIQDAASTDSQKNDGHSGHH